MALAEPMRGGGKRIAGKTEVGGEQFETLVLSLDGEQFIERVLPCRCQYCPVGMPQGMLESETTP